MANKSNVELWNDIHAYREQVQILTEQLLGIAELQARAERLQAELDACRKNFEKLQSDLAREKKRSFAKTQAARGTGYSEGVAVGRKER